MYLVACMQGTCMHVYCYTQSVCMVPYSVAALPSDGRQQHSIALLSGGQGLVWQWGAGGIDGSTTDQLVVVLELLTLLLTSS